MYVLVQKTAGCVPEKPLQSSHTSNSSSVVCGGSQIIRYGSRHIQNERMEELKDRNLVSLCGIVKHPGPVQVSDLEDVQIAGLWAQVLHVVEMVSDERLDQPQISTATSLQKNQGVAKRQKAAGIFMDPHGAGSWLILFFEEDFQWDVLLTNRTSFEGHTEEITCRMKANTPHWNFFESLRLTLHFFHLPQSSNTCILTLTTHRHRTATRN